MIGGKIEMRIELALLQYSFLELMSSNSSSDSLRRKLEDIFKLMLLVWAREGQAIKTVSGKQNGL